MAGLQVWAGQLGVLAPWGAIAVAAPGPLGHLPPFATWALIMVKLVLLCKMVFVFESL